MAVSMRGLLSRQAQATPEPAPAAVALSSKPLLSNATVRALEGAELKYRAIVSSGGWPQIPSGRVFRPGDGDPRDPLLARRLAISNDLKLPAGQPDMGSAASLGEALRLFQARHGLSPSGLIDSATLEALNVTAEVRLAQLRASTVNVQAELVSAASSSGRSVIVNIPGFYLEAVDERGVALRHRVVVGRLERPTPTVSAKIKAINFLPSWRVPDSSPARI